MYRYLIVLFLITFLFSSCGEECEDSESKTTVYNPNGDSELALLMREIYDVSDEVKNHIGEDGYEFPENFLELFTKVHIVEPTDSDVKTIEFRGMSMHSASLARELIMSKGSEVGQKYDELINSCILCHHSYCPGPIKRINKLKRAS